MMVDEFADYGIERMDEEKITGFLTGQSVGVLGLPTDGAPSMRPLSYWFDGDSRLYFLYVLGDDSKKEALSRASEVARFLVYRADSAFSWQSVLLTGSVTEVPADRRADVEAAMELPRRPDALARASEGGRTLLYEFRIDDRVGIEHLGLPPGFEEERPST